MPTILVIDDHALTLKTLCLILHAKNYLVLPAENAEQARDLFSRRAVELVILDYFLPDGTGSELAAELKRTKNVPVIMLSGSAELRGKPDSVDILLAKPCSIPDLLETIDALLARKLDSLRRSA